MAARSVDPERGSPDMQWKMNCDDIYAPFQPCQGQLPNIEYMLASAQFWSFSNQIRSFYYRPESIRCVQAAFGIQK